MARKEDKLRPYRVDYFNIDEMKDVDLALVRSTVVRAVTSAEAATKVLNDNETLPIVLIRSYRYYKQITHKKDVYKPVEELFNEKNALIVMGEVEKYRAAIEPTSALIAPLNVTEVTLPVPPAAPADENGHVTRFSDSSLYDEVCTNCGATDTSGKLEDPCPGAHEPTWSGGLKIPVTADHATPDPAYGVEKATFYKSNAGTQVKTQTPCYCSFTFPMSEEDMQVHLAAVHNAPLPTSGPNSPATVAAVADLNGMLSHDEHEQAMDTFVPDAGAVEDYNRVFPEPTAINNPMPGTPSINPFVVTPDEPLSLQLKVLAFAVITILVVSGLIYFLRH